MRKHYYAKNGNACWAFNSKGEREEWLFYNPNSVPCSRATALKMAVPVHGNRPLYGRGVEIWREEPRFVRLAE
jgi:hypothetical protein